MQAPNVISEPKNLMVAYQELVQTGKLQDDPAQKQLIDKLYKLQQELQMWEFARSSGFFQKIFSASGQTPPPKGMYIYGEVGRGKSMVMDLFFSTMPWESKRRVHFHAFMLEVHRVMFRWRKSTKNDPKAHDPIPPLAKLIATESQLLCFDEFQVTDIADAMILGRLFSELFRYGVVVVATSNIHPDDLYKDGLQRENFQPFIDLFKRYVTIEPLRAKQDYRLSYIQAMMALYVSPLDKKAQEFMAKTFGELTQHMPVVKTNLEIGGRTLVLERTCGDVAWVTFEQLCSQALGAADYIEISREFSTILMEGIPQFNRDNRNECKRFVTFIDELYEHKVKLICTAAATPQYLYTEGKDHTEFQRTVSRLMEMQSEKYLRLSHVT